MRWIRSDLLIVFGIVYGIGWGIIARKDLLKDAKSDNIAEKSKGRCNINMQKIISVCFVVLLVLTGIVVVYVVLHGGTPEVIESVFGVKVLGISWVVLLVVGIWRGLRLAIKRRKDAKSDDITVRAKALYELGCEEWQTGYKRGELYTGGLIGFIVYGRIGFPHSKEVAIEHWLQAANLGHEGAIDKLNMAQIRRGL